MGAIVVSRLGKAYKQYGSQWARLAEWLFPWRQRHRLKWVLKQITFDVRPGEAVGVIGINGAGKSTLLKLITGTTLPTTGSIKMSGRVAAMLELGMGFHPDFTGRQNAIMAGQLLGVSTADLIRLMPEIEAFSEIGDYMDAPVRMYSSGMQMRLAFSVATAVRPDILIVDEALSVGDAYFQHKSFERIRAFREQGTTLLIVSHDKAAIQSICDRAILLDGGQLVMQGEPEAVMDYYNAMLADRENQTVLQRIDSNGKTQTVSGSGEAVIEKIRLLDLRGQPVEVVRTGQPIHLQVDVAIRSDVADLVLGFMIKDRLGQPVFGTNSHHMGQALKSLRAGQSITFTIELLAQLGFGTYSLALALHAGENHIAKNYEWRDLALVFNVVNTDKAEFVGVTWLPHQMDIRISIHE
jgi:lipopolysaccharide transport system ATP-binding protein